ncbi:MAG TPA: hypothetical protein PK239_13945 [Chitinophagales bacterium]|nr:hypothetical protein [Chitinophagales bacterium]
MFTTKRSPLKKLIIGEKVSTAKGYGSVTKIGRLHNISGSSCYNYAQFYRLVMANLALLKQSRPSPVRQEKARLILQEYLLHHSSVRSIVKALRYRAIGIGKGEVSETIGRYGSCLAVYDVLPEDSYVCLAIDETFSGSTPYLAMIDSRTGYLVGLMKAANRQSDTWSQHTGKQRAQAMLQNLQSLLTKSNRSSSMIETANSRLKPFLRAATGQISQERLNLIRRYLNHCPYERSRVHDRRRFSPYQLFYQKKEDKRNWYTILFEDFLNKSA